MGLPCSIAGVAQAYEDFLDLLVCDTRDARAADCAAPQPACDVQCAQTIMRTAEDKAALGEGRALLRGSRQLLQVSANQLSCHVDQP